MITSKYLKMLPLWLLMMAVLPMKAARQSYTLTSTFYALSEGMLVASENNCSWTPSPYNSFYQGQVGFSFSSKVVSSEGIKMTSEYTITGTIQSIKLTACGKYYSVVAKAGNTTLGTLNIGSVSGSSYTLVEQTIPITATDVTNQSVTLVFSLNDNLGQQQTSFCEFTKVAVSYLDPKAAAGLSFSPTSATATVGESFTPPTLNNPNKLSVSWSSSNTGVATVSNTGAITLVKDGTTTIKASFAGNDDYLAGEASYSLTVKAPTLSAPTFSLAAGTYDAVQSLTLSTTKQGADIYYSIDNGAAQKYTSAITISQSCTVSAYIQYMGYKSATDSRKYVIRQAVNLSFSAATASATLGDGFTPPTLNNPSSLSLTWSSSNTGVATVSNTGAVTIVGAGTTKITASFAGDATRLPASASYSLTVSAPSLSAPTFSLAAGTYDEAQILTLSTTKQGADIYYSIDNGAAQNYTGAITISESCTVTAYVQYMGYKSATDSRKYVIRQDPELSFISDECTVIFGDYFYSPYLSNRYDVPVKYASSDPTVAQVNSIGDVDIKKEGETTISATFPGNAYFLPDQASYKLYVKHRVDSAEVAGAYKLWVNGVRVTQDNRLDILGDGKGKENPSVMFDGKQTLVLSNAKLDSIVTQLSKELTLYIQGDNTVKSNNTPAVHQTAEQRVTFKVTTSGNYPGTLTLTSPVSVTDGFIRTTLEQPISVLREMTDEIMYGTVLFPFTYSVTITFPPSDFLNSDGDEIDLSNQVVNNILFTLRSANEDGYDEEQQAIIMNTPMKRDVYSPNPVGSGLYAEQFCGMTFMIPAGKGEIIIDNIAKDGYLLGVKVGNKSTVLFQNSFWTKSTITYNVTEPTYVRLFNAGTGTLARMRGGKKTTTRIGIRSIVIKPQQIAASNEVQSVIPQATTIDNNPIIETGIIEMEITRPLGDEWYNLNGQRIDQPTKEGIYVRRGRKVIIK